MSDSLSNARPDTHPVIDPSRWLGNFGLKEFRPGQRQVIDAIMSGRDTLCIMPTGGGKSLCFQLPTIARDGVTIVVSPLIALMKDQVDSLNQRQIPATFINSSLSQAQQQSRINGMVGGEYKLVYIAPERLRSSSFMRAIDRTHIQLLAVDESHCISQWGHDFRPDYARLGRFRKRLGNPQTVALTATATSLVQDDIKQILELKDPAHFVTGFARTNLFLKVQSPNGNVEKDQQLVDFLKSHSGSGIVYASTRKNCEHLVDLLDEELGRTFAFYHAGLPADARRDVQHRFMSGEIEVIVATNAFGMGIDKPDLRFVVHYNLPGSVEAYYQEAGRAGRDGLPSECLMLYSFQDKFIQEFFIDNSYPSRETIRDVYEYLRAIDSNPIEVTLQDIKDDLQLTIGTSGIGNCETLLEKAGAIERLDSKQNSAGIRIDSDLPTLIDYLPKDARTRRHVLRGIEKLVGRSRHERVLFHPQSFADRLEMKWDAVKRAINELIKLPAISYIPPFRGRAVYVTNRSIPFDQLQIDFAEMEKHKQSEYDKLQSMINLATTRRCRQLEILEYFGDPDRQTCGNCDICNKRPQGKVGTAQHANAGACLYAAQVALSGAARTHGRIGKTLIAQMLTGSGSKKIKQLGLHRLSTFGLLKSLRQTDVTALLEFLVNHRYLEQHETIKYRPVVQISESGTRLMSGETEIDLTRMMPGDLVNELSLKLGHKKPHVQGMSNESGAVKESDSSTDEKSADALEVEIQQGQPAVEETIARSDDAHAVVPPAMHVPVSGHSTNDLGEKKCDDSKPSPQPSPSGRGSNIGSPQPSPRGRGSKIGSYYWTWKLFNDGYDQQSIEQIRQIGRETVMDHIVRAIEEGHTVDPAWIISPDKLQRLVELIAEHPEERATRLIARLPSHISSQELLLFLKCRPGYGASASSWADERRRTVQ